MAAHALSQEMPQEPAWPKKIRVGKEQFKYNYTHLFGNVWKCVKPADGWPAAKDDTLFIMKLDPKSPEEGGDTDNSPWKFLAVHAHRDTDNAASLLEHGKAVFGSEEDDVLTAGAHVWWYFDEKNSGWAHLGKFETTHLPSDGRT
jgi:hypothetical protein